jgi:hypothetical protein
VDAWRPPQTVGRLRAPSVPVPESLIRVRPWQGDPRTSPSAGAHGFHPLHRSPDRPDDTVPVPESFRGGCSVGAGSPSVWEDPGLSRIVAMGCALDTPIRPRGRSPDSRPPARSADSQCALSPVGRRRAITARRRRRRHRPGPACLPADRDRHTATRIRISAIEAPRPVPAEDPRWTGTRLRKTGARSGPRCSARSGMRTTWSAFSCTSTAPPSRHRAPRGCSRTLPAS